MENLKQKLFGKKGIYLIIINRPDGTLPKSKEYFTHEIAKYAP